MNTLENPYEPHRKILLELARTSIEHGVETGKPPAIEVSSYDPLLRVNRATFVTLDRNGRLRGCIGYLEPVEPLVVNLSRNAVSSALHDRRFSPVKKGEINELTISISILSIPKEVKVASESELLKTLRPNIDGLILEDGRRRTTFLPSVWNELPNPKDFVRHLKMKAGWSPDYWSHTIKVYFYHADYLTDLE